MSRPCEQLLLQISRALDGDLAAPETTELTAHLAHCTACRLRAIELVEANGLFQELVQKRAELAAPDANFAPQIMDRLRLEAATAGGLLEFSRLVAQDPDLQNQFRPATTPVLFAELFVSVGWQRGYRFGPGEVVSLLAARHAANDDLSDEQLDAVVGGAGAADAALHAFIGNVLQNFFKPTT
ncbi:MAG: anti-sigma factor [Rhodoferax sp.]